MKNLIRCSVLIMLLISFSACESEPITDIAKIEKELKTVVKDNGFTKCSVVGMHGESVYTEHDDADFTISGGFVVVTAYANCGTYEDRYNLLYLSKYMIDIDNKLVLYFANIHY